VVYSSLTKSLPLSEIFLELIWYLSGIIDLINFLTKGLIFLFSKRSEIKSLRVKLLKK